MTSIPLSDEQADRIGEHPGAIGIAYSVYESLIREHICNRWLAWGQGPHEPPDGICENPRCDGSGLIPVPVTFTRPCPECLVMHDITIEGGEMPHGSTHRCSGRVPVTVPCPDHGCGHGSKVRHVRACGRPCRVCNDRLMIPAQARVVHVFPTVDVIWRRKEQPVESGWTVTRSHPTVNADLRWWVGDAPWVLLLEWGR